MSAGKALEKVKSDFEEVVKLVNKNLGIDYATKNPAMIQHLMAMIQEEENRLLARKINNV